jgi:hypothetical protein
MEEEEEKKKKKTKKKKKMLEKDGEDQSDRSCKNIKKYDVESRRREKSYIKYKEGKLIGLVTYCVGAAF